MLLVVTTLIVIGNQVCFAQDIGRVFIGSASNATLSSLTITNNVAGTTTDSIPVFVDAINGTIASNIIGNVQVTCETLFDLSGFSSATFSTVTLSNTVRTGTVTLSALRTGRPVDIQCYGQSLAAGVEQFTRATSRSNILSLTVVSAPTLSICSEDVVYVSNSLNTQQEPFTIEFSDRVTAAGGVTVSCTVVLGSGTMTLNIPNKVVVVNTTRDTMPYTLTGIGTPVQVTCSATGYNEGFPVTFQLLDPVLAFYPPAFTVTSNQFGLKVLLTSYKDLYNSTTGSLPLTCQADLFSQINNAQNAAENPPCASVPAVTTATTVATTNAVTTPNVTTPATVTTTGIPTIPEWGISRVEPLQPDQDIYYQNINVTRNLPVTSAVQEYIVISCCTTNLPTTQLQTATLITADLKRNISIDWTQATLPIAVDSESEYKNPAYVNISPCPCDITQDACDVECCCDNDCSQEEKNAFSSCIGGLIGGGTAALPEYDCRSTHYNKEDWFHLMCVEREYNGLIGFFYGEFPAIRNQEKLDAQVSSESFYSYSRKASTASTSPQTYREGYPVQSIKEAPGGRTVERIGKVSLPQPILSGECLTTSPVRYLMNRESSCNFEMTADMCTSSSVFSSLFYIQPSAVRDPSCPNLFSILGSPGDSTVTETVVNYHCAGDLSGYVKNTGITQTDVTSSTLFNFTLPTDPNCVDSCGNYICPENVTDTSTSDITQYPRCTFDDGYTQAPVPTNNLGTCQNAVLDVRYNFYWNGSNILKLNATVLLGNIPLSNATNPVEVSQKYEAKFIHTFSGSAADTADNFRQVETAFDRSGKPGYDIDKPLWSGVQINNNTDNSFLYINTNSSQQMAVWQTGTDGLCYNAGRKLVSFGQDIYSSCFVKLDLENLRNCSNLRKIIVNRLNNLMKADKIGRFGVNNYLNSAYWIDVTREDLTNVCTGYVETVQDITNNTILSYTAEGFCTDIVSGIHLDILYAVTGKTYGIPIYEIIGAHISYIKSEWHLTCGIGENSGCSIPGYVESFEITSSIRFILVPGNTPARVPRYQDSRYYNLCGQDICWDAFIYPISSAYEGADKGQVLVMVLLFILVLLGFLVFLRPWWYIL